MILKETVAFYVNNGSPIYCTFLGASKALDRVEYRKLFRLLLKRKLLLIVLCMLYNICVSHRTRVEWNGVWSDAFNALNGVNLLTSN